MRGGGNVYLYFILALRDSHCLSFLTLSAMCGALASAATDKCHPVLLADGEHSSNTARSLRDAFHPIHTALHTIQASLNLSTGKP